MHRSVVSLLSCNKSHFHVYLEFTFLPEKCKKDKGSITQLLATAANYLLLFLAVFHQDFLDVILLRAKSSDRADLKHCRCLFCFLYQLLFFYKTGKCSFIFLLFMASVVNTVNPQKQLCRLFHAILHEILYGNLKIVVFFPYGFGRESHAFCSCSLKIHEI